MVYDEESCDEEKDRAGRVRSLSLFVRDNEDSEERNGVPGA